MRTLTWVLLVWVFVLTLVLLFHRPTQAAPAAFPSLDSLDLGKLIPLREEFELPVPRLHGMEAGHRCQVRVSALEEWAMRLPVHLQDGGLSGADKCSFLPARSEYVPGAYHFYRDGKLLAQVRLTSGFGVEWQPNRQGAPIITGTWLATENGLTLTLEGQEFCLSQGDGHGGYFQPYGRIGADRLTRLTADPYTHQMMRERNTELDAAASRRPVLPGSF